MSYQWIDGHGLASPTDGAPLGERRRDHQTAEKVGDALRACSTHAQAQALQCQQVDLATALRVLARPTWRRGMSRNAVKC